MDLTAWTSSVVPQPIILNVRLDVAMFFLVRVEVLDSIGTSREEASADKWPKKQRSGK